MLTLKDFNLQDDPFAVSPPKEKIIWVDREGFRQQLKNAFRRSLLSTPSRIIACIYGNWGAGKTHAMTYFSKPEVMGPLIKEMELKVSLPISIPITFPLGNVLDTIYLEIIEQIGISQIIQALDTLESETIRPKRPFEKKVSGYMDPRVAEAFVKLKGKKPFLFQRYLSMTATSTELRGHGIARGISTLSDKVRTVSGILNLLTGTIASRVFIWFDDMERIGDMPGREIFGFQYFIRDLLDNVPKNLIIILQFTMLPGEEVEDRLAYLGDAVRYRISDKISVQPMTGEEFLSYVRGLLKAFRLEPSKEDEYFPFERDALEFVSSELRAKHIPLEPRNVNEALSSALSEALNDVEKTDPVITKAYIETRIKDVFSRVGPPKREKS